MLQISITTIVIIVVVIIIVMGLDVSLPFTQHLA
jgi:Sec-independent protein translocase protein TatA